jgi:O-antigen ligase
MGRIGSEGIVDDGRWAVYEFCLRSIWERPLFGAGIGTFVDLFPSMRADNFPSKGVWDYAHSTILEIAVEMGVPVAATIVIFSLAALYMLSRAAIKLEGRDRWSLAAIAGILVLTFLHSIIDFSLQIPGYLIFFGVLLGCGLARAASSSRSPVFHEHPTQP